MREPPSCPGRRAVRGAAAWLATGALLASGPVPALELGAVRIEGVSGALETNIRARLSLTQHPDDAPLTEARLSYLLRQAPGEVLTALEPFGFYEPQVRIAPTREGERVDVAIAVERGAAVKVRSQAIVIAGDAGDDPVLEGHRTAFRPAVGQPLDHRVYELSKSTIQRSLLERGYFDAEPGQQRVAVTRAEHAADIVLSWDSGPRYVFGATEFVDSHIDQAVLRRHLGYAPGEPFHHAQLVELHQSLAALEYFGLIDIQPRPEQGAPATAPIEVALTPAKRSLYTAGLSYGTDHGAAIELGLQRRYVNTRGHKFDASVALGQRRTLGSVVYRIPARHGPLGWWSAGLNAREEEIAGFGRTETVELVVGRNGEVGGYSFAAEMHALRQYYDERASTAVYPQLHVAHSEGDHPLYPRRGFGWSATARAGHAAIGSDVDFAQLFADAIWIHPLGADQRLIVRGAAGASWTDAFPDLPPALRFYAGGDRSVRGYGYQEIGPRDAEGRVVGGRHLLVASAEYEHMFSDSWGAALFVDAGDAFHSGAFDARVGVGVGLRWRSPVGPVRVDVGVGLDEPDRAVRLHLTIGPRL